MCTYDSLTVLVIRVFSCDYPKLLAVLVHMLGHDGLYFCVMYMFAWFY